MKQRITLADLSRKTGFSQATISMILARRTDVSFSEETIRLVKETAAEMGYTGVTRRRVTLFSRRTIMVVCPFLLNHYYSAVVQAVQIAASQSHCNILVHTTYNDSELEGRILKVMAESDIGGIIFTMMPQSKNILDKIASTLPIVVISDREEGLPVDFVELHNYKAGSLVAAHLAQLGHKNIACIATPGFEAIHARKIRYDGLKNTWNEVCPGGTLSLLTNFVNPSMMRDNVRMERYLGQQITLELLKDRFSEITALVGLNDMIAYGILDAMCGAGKKIPQDFSVCGCDNDFPSDLAGVNLTSVEHFMVKNAHLAFQILHSKMTGRDGTQNALIRIDIQPELVRRASTGPVDS